MQIGYTEEEQILLCMLRQEAVPEDSPFDRVKQLANQHAILSLLGDILWKDEDVQRFSMRIIAQYYHLLFKTKYYVNLLSEAGIDTVILKGFPVAQYYPVPQLRKSGDIDLLLLHPEDIERAVDILQSHHVILLSNQHSNYHVAMLTEEQIEIELHTSITEELDDSNLNRKLQKMQRELPKHVEMVQILDNTFPVLSPGYQAFSLLLHMLHHFVRSGFGLKLLMDWTYFWNHGMEQSEREIYHRLIREFGLRGFSEMISGACFYQLGLSDATLIGTKIKRETCERFLKDVLKGQEFGAPEDHHMVTMRGTRLRDYMREFHHQMHLNFPKAGGIFVIWPVLWVLTFIRFSINNRTVRNTSVLEVLRGAKERSSYMSEIRLFRR